MRAFLLLLLAGFAPSVAPGQSYDVIIREGVCSTVPVRPGVTP